MVIILFHVAPHWSGLVWTVKYLNFWQKLPIRTDLHPFVDGRHFEVTKNSYYYLSLKWSQKKVSDHGLRPVCRDAYIHYFKINPLTFCCPLFSENYFNTQVRINKMIN